MIIPVFAVAPVFFGVVFTALAVLSALALLLLSSITYAWTHKQCFGQWVHIVVSVGSALLSIGAVVLHAYCEDGGDYGHLIAIFACGFLSAGIDRFLFKRIRLINIHHYGFGQFDHVP